MKIKVKGLVFVGAAAAILLSAGAANAAKTARSSDASGVVTSQKYSDEKYEYWSDKVDGTVKGSDLVTAATNENKYPSMASMKEYTNPSTANSGELVTYNPTGLLGSTHIVTRAESITQNGAYEWKDGYEGSETRVPSEKAVVKALDAVESSIHQNAVNGSTYVTVTPEAGEAGTTVAITPAMLVTAAADVTSANGAKLVTASAVQKKTGANEKMMVANADGAWTSISNAVLDGTYVDVSGVNSNGAVTLDITSAKITTSGAQLAASDDGTGTNANGDEADLVTAKAVKEYVASTGLGGELAAMPDTCKNSTAHCALVSTWDANNSKMTLTWTPMAQ